VIKNVLVLVVEYFEMYIGKICTCTHKKKELVLVLSMYLAPTLDIAHRREKLKPKVLCDPIWKTSRTTRPNWKKIWVSI